MPDAVIIIFEETPNPDALKLTLNRPVAAQGKTYRGDPAAAEAPWAKALLAIPGVLGVYGVNNFISINKRPEADWQEIVAQAEPALKAIYGP